MSNWVQPSSLEERLRETVVPGPWHLRYRLAKELRKGERELHLVPMLVDPAKAAVDIGANQGVWTLHLARCAAHVYAFEPNPKIHRWLKRNITERNVTISQVALSDAPGTAELRVPRYTRGFSNQHATLADSNRHENYGSVEVKTDTLDSLTLDKVGFIKIDVEGHEMTVLKGARETLARCRPKMVVEIEERHTKRRIEELIAEVEAYGYQALALTRQGLVLASTLDFDKQHRLALGTPAYVNNFIFLPR